MNHKMSLSSKSSFGVVIILLFLSFSALRCLPLHAQDSNSDLARYTPRWIRDGFIDAGTTHEPWIFQVRRNSPKFNQWQKEKYDYEMTGPFIKALAESGVTVYHVSCYKGFGFEAEKENMQKVAKAVAIAHKYGMKADTYVQWNTMAYETFFAEVPEAKTDRWYQVDENGKPLMLTYGYQQSFRYRPCFNHDGYMNYFKNKILRYVVDSVKTDFIHFDNFDYNYPPSADFNPATIKAFRKYLNDKYTPSQRKERFGFTDLSYVIPPMWNRENPAEKVETINDPVVQEWIDFRCQTFTSRLAECARFVRKMNKEVVIEINPHGLVGSNRAWEAGINHPDLMQYTNVIWTEDQNYPRWENGVAIGKFRHYKLGRTTHNFIMTGNSKPQDFAENLALNRTVGSLGHSIPDGTGKQYMDFWLAHKDLYTRMQGAEKVAVLRSFPSMAYNNYDTQMAVNMAEQALQQHQIPFDIIFDQQIGKLSNYEVVVLADQESLTGENILALKKFAENGGGLVITGNTGKYDGWRRLRSQSMPDMLAAKSPATEPDGNMLAETRPVSFYVGKGRVIYIPALIQKQGKTPLGFESVWRMPENDGELEAAVYWAAGKQLPLEVTAPEWVGVSHDHDTKSKRDIIHLFNYKNSPAGGITLRYNGKIKTAWAVSPDREGKMNVPFREENGITELWMPELKVYEVVVLERP